MSNDATKASPFLNQPGQDISVDSTGDWRSILDEEHINVLIQSAKDVTVSYKLLEDLQFSSDVNAAYFGNLDVQTPALPVNNAWVGDEERSGDRKSVV